MIGLIILCVLAGCRHDRSYKILNDIDRADSLIAADKVDEALEILLEAESQLDETVTPWARMQLYTSLAGPYYDSYVHRYGTAKMYCEKAVAVAREADSLQWLPPLLWNLVINTQNGDSIVALLKECRDLSDRYEYRSLAYRSRINLAKIDIMYRNSDEAERLFDTLECMGEIPGFNIELTLYRSLLYWNKGDLPAAVKILQSIDSDNLLLDGKVTRYTWLYKIMWELGEYEKSMAYRDSLIQCDDSIKGIISSENLSKAESRYAQSMIREEGKRRLAWIVSGGVVLLLIITMAFLIKSRLMKMRQLRLIESISRLNLRLSELEGKDDAPDASSDKIAALIEKFRLTREFYFTLPQSAVIEQLNMEPNPEDISQDRLKAVTDSVIGNFAESCGNLRQLTESVTPEDTLMCVLVYVGIRRDVIGVIMKVSEDAMRKRKSRIKQKLPAPLFELFFSK